MSVRDSPVLDLPVELVRAIFGTVVDAGRMRDVLHLGLTCRALWTTAASFIWRTANAEDAVLQGLGFPGVITSKWLDTEGWLRHTPIPVSAGVEDRLARYGPLIRNLDLAAYWRYDDALRSPLRAAFTMLFDRADICTFFPKLSSLTLFIHGNSDDIAHVHEHLLQSPVSALSIEFAVNCSISRITRTLRDIRPSNIVRLSLLCTCHLTKTTAENNTVLSTFISQCHDLKSLWLLFTPGCKPMLQDIAHLAIEHFTLFTRVFYYLEPSYWTLPERTFDSLRSLTLHGPPTSSTIGLLQAISSPSVMRIELCVEDRSGTPVRPVMEVISKKWSHSLTALVLWQVQFSAVPGSAAFFDTITPLLQCRRMQECTIVGALEQPLDDEHAFQIANSWSDLRLFGVLYLFCEPGPGLTNSGPLALAHFAEHCPRLEQLQIAMEFSYAGVDKCPKTFSQPSPLIHLDGSSLSAGDMRASDIADFVRAIFPHAVNIGCPPGCQDRHCATLGVHCDSTWMKRWERRFWAVQGGGTGPKDRVSWS